MFVGDDECIVLWCCFGFGECDVVLLFLLSSYVCKGLLLIEVVL